MVVSVKMIVASTHKTCSFISVSNTIFLYSVQIPKKSERRGQRVGSGQFPTVYDIEPNWGDQLSGNNFIVLSVIYPLYSSNAERYFHACFSESCSIDVICPVEFLKTDKLSVPASSDQNVSKLPSESLSTRSFTLWPL